MQFTPLYDRLLVRRAKEPEPVPGALVVPDSAKEKPMEGEVLAVGQGRITDAGTVIPMCVKAGDHVLMSKYAGAEIKVDGEELLILREDEVLGIVRKDGLDPATVSVYRDARLRVEGMTRHADGSHVGAFEHCGICNPGLHWAVVQPAAPETPAERLEALRAIPRTTE